MVAAERVVEGREVVAMEVVATAVAREVVVAAGAREGGGG